MVQTTEDYQPTKLEQVIKKALDENLNCTCPHCGRDISYENYSNPVEAIALAVIEYIKEIRDGTLNDNG